MVASSAMMPITTSISTSVKPRERELGSNDDVIFGSIQTIGAGGDQDEAVLASDLSADGGIHEVGDETGVVAGRNSDARGESIINGAYVNETVGRELGGIVLDRMGR